MRQPNSKISKAAPKRYLILIAVFALLSCGTRTSIVSIADEGHRNSRFSVMAVSAPYEDLEIRSYVEGLFQEVLSSDQVTAHKAMDLLPPLNPYTYSEFQKTMQENGVECVLVVSIADFWTTFYTSPGEVKTETNSETSFNSWGSLFGFYTSGQSTTSSTSKTKYVPGLTLSQSNVRLDARLFIVNPDTLPFAIWRANSTTAGNYFTSNSYIMIDAATEIGQKLEEEGIIKSTENR